MMMFEVLKARTKTWRRRRDTAVELQRLSDRDLSDIGISRSYIERIANQVIEARP